jgi:Flp pilus assembly protein TadD
MKITRAGRYMELGNNIDARKIYEEIIKLVPNSVIALNNLAWIIADDDIEAGLELAKRAYDLMPERGDVADTYGYILFRKGSVPKAVEILELAAKLSPENQEILDHLSEARGRL